MKKEIKKIVKRVAAALDLVNKFRRGIDYGLLSQYILRINQHRDIDKILCEVSRCLKDILDHELFGFGLKKGNSLDLWINHPICRRQFNHLAAHDFDGQNIDINLHCFEGKTNEESHNYDTIDLNSLIAVNVMDEPHSARLYFMPKKRRRAHHDMIINTIVRSMSIALENSLNIKQLENAAAIDPLTNCYNRRALNTFIERDIAYAQRYGNDLSVIMLDMDNFKEINDEHGHDAGDAVLKNISTLVPSLVRKSDYLARYGGEEFVLVLPDTPLYNAVSLAEKLRKKFEGLSITAGKKAFRVTASFGVACLRDGSDSNGLLREADERVYQAKAMGKNTVVPAPPPPCPAYRRHSPEELLLKYSRHVRVA